MQECAPAADARFSPGAGGKDACVLPDEPLCIESACAPQVSACAYPEGSGVKEVCGQMRGRQGSWHGCQEECAETKGPRGVAEDVFFRGVYLRPEARSDADDPGRDFSASQRYRRHNSMAKALILLVRLYQRFISPCLGSHCRFVPSCSSYACDALARYGTAGLLLSLIHI